jgi:hypothetical protein
MTALALLAAIKRTESLLSKETNGGARVTSDYFGRGTNEQPFFFREEMMMLCAGMKFV